MYCSFSNRWKFNWNLKISLADSEREIVTQQTLYTFKYQLLRYITHRSYQRASSFAVYECKYIFSVHTLHLDIKDYHDKLYCFINCLLVVTEVVKAKHDKQTNTTCTDITVVNSKARSIKLQFKSAPGPGKPDGWGNSKSCVCWRHRSTTFSYREEKSSTSNLCQILGV